MELDQLNQWKRTQFCGELTLSNLNQEVTLMGWINTRRDHGGVIFVDLRDYTGICQVVFNPQYNLESHQKADQIRSEYVIAIQGKVVARDEEARNPKMQTGDIEIMVISMKILNTSQPLPFQLDDEDTNEKIRLTYRYLDLRRPALQKNFIVRSQVTKIIRDYFHQHQFFEIETPVLTKSTPEGARDFLVPSRLNPGSFYALPQSPQIFKQLLMVSGFDRYFQIVKCFRDEDLRGNRQPEFTQIDAELSFTNPEEIYAIMEGMMAQIFQDVLGHKIALPIPRMTYQQAMDEYGSDAPDLRFDLKLKNLTEALQNSACKVFSDAIARGGIVKAINVPGGAKFSRKELDELTEFVKIYQAKGMAWIKVNPDGWQSPITKFFQPEEISHINQIMEAQVGDLILFGADQPKIVHDALGNLRKEIARRLNLTNPTDFNFVWITDFPLFEYSEEEQRYTSSHHPFTMPVIEDLEKWGSDNPAQIKSIAYDLVLNGVEIGGGSLRIHQEEIQKQIFQLLKLSQEEAEEKFGFLLQALKLGAPPHGGIAFGLDRLMMFLVQTNAIRDVIAFPKTQQGSCLLSQAPSEINNHQINDLNIRLIKK